MKQDDLTRDLLTEHLGRYPQLNIQDIFKFLYQSAFGCEHLVSSLNRVTDGIEREYADLCRVDGRPLVERLDGEYSRVHLCWLDKGLKSGTLAKLFSLSAKKEPEGLGRLLEKLDTVRELVKEGGLPFSADEFEAALAKWQDNGFEAVRHSDGFREAYRPAYRVIANRFVPFLPLFAELDRRLDEGEVLLAVEGGSASGKTTLGGLLEQIYGCALIHMDDFFLRPEQRCPERFAQVGGNVDRERFLAEVLLPLSRGEAIRFRPFDCSTMTLADAVQVPQRRLTVVEGAYSMHPELAEFYDLSVYLDLSDGLQRERILHRNSPQTAQMFFEKWIPLERVYFSETKIKERCDMVIEIE